METAVAVLASSGQFESLFFKDAARPSLLPHQVEIQVEAAALNFKDVLLALELIPSPGGATGDFGFECAGRVSRIGSKVSGLVPGDSVVAVGSGCLATTVAVSAETVCRRPRHLTPLQAVTIPIAFVTASYALEDLARLRPSDSVLIHAGTGGVGLAAIQIARKLGAQIFATAGSEEKRQYLRSLGIAQVMNSRTPAFAGQIQSATKGRGVDVVLNSLSGDLLRHSIEVLAPHGRFVELGARDAIAGHTVALSLFRRGASFCFVGYDGPVPGIGARLASAMKRAASGEWQPLPMRVFPRVEAGQALAHLAAARHIGKVAVEILPTGSTPLDSSNLLAPAEGARIFEICLSMGRARIAVSKVPLSQRIGNRAPVRDAEPPPTGRRHPRPALETPFAAPRSEIESKIAAAWGRHFNLEAIGLHDDFFSLGGDSLLAVQVAHTLRSSLNLDLPAHLLLENPTVAALASRLLVNAPAPAVARHLVRLAAGPPAERPVFLVHPIGGHVYFYMPIAKRLAQHASVWGLQAQGVDGEAPPLPTIEEMASRYILAMRTVQPSGPYRLGGSSFGGVVCFEMARQLAAAGDSVDLLALIDSPTPSSLAWTFRSDAEILAYMLARGEDIEPHLRELSVMPEDRMLRYFLAHGGAGETVAPDATIESVRHFLRLFRANYDALVNYRLQRYESDGLFFYATEHNTFNTRGFEKEWLPFLNRLELIAVPGNHTTMNLPPHHDRMVWRIAAAIAAAAKQQPLEEINV